MVRVAVTTASTRSSFAICGMGFLLFLYCITEVPEITLIDPNCARSPIKASVMPSVKYSCELSLERFTIGSTAKDVISGAAWSQGTSLRHSVRTVINNRARTAPPIMARGERHQFAATPRDDGS